jgi:hypothetical protein
MLQLITTKERRVAGTAASSKTAQAAEPRNASTPWGVVTPWCSSWSPWSPSSW